MFLPFVPNGFVDSTRNIATPTLLRLSLADNILLLLDRLYQIDC